MVDVTDEIGRIARLSKDDVGTTEENVKQKIVVPLLGLLGHNKEDLEFEYTTNKGGKIDIFIKNVPHDCKVLIDTKKYDEDLTKHVGQIKNYAIDEGVLLAILVNGSEIRIYSNLRGMSFANSLLYSIERQKLVDSKCWSRLSNLLNVENLKNGNAIKTVEEREKEIKKTISKEEEIKQEYKAKKENINDKIKSKNREIEQLKEEQKKLSEETEKKISDLWKSLGLPHRSFSYAQSYSKEITIYGSHQKKRTKARKISFKELENNGLLQDGQILYFYHNGRPYENEKARVNISDNKLEKDGKYYTPTGLAKELLARYGFRKKDQQVQGPRFWVTENGVSLNELNEKIRMQERESK